MRIVLDDNLNRVVQELSNRHEIIGILCQPVCCNQMTEGMGRNSTTFWDVSEGIRHPVLVATWWLHEPKTKKPAIN